MIIGAKTSVAISGLTTVVAVKALIITSALVPFRPTVIGRWFGLGKEGGYKFIHDIFGYSTNGEGWGATTRVQALLSVVEIRGSSLKQLGERLRTLVRRCALVKRQTPSLILEYIPYACQKGSIIVQLVGKILAMSNEKVDTIAGSFMFGGYLGTKVAILNGVPLIHLALLDVVFLE